VRGPLNIKRSRQGQPVIFQAGASNDGRNFAARRAEAIFAGAQTLEEAQEYYRDVKQRAKGFGRDADALSILPGIGPVIGLTEAEAEAKYRELSDLGSLQTGLGFLARAFSDHDFSVYDLDAPFPDVEHIGRNSNQSSSYRILAQVRAENLTLRQIAQRLSVPRGAFAGTPAQVADELQNWFENEGADGFVLFETLPGQLELFVEHVVPILQARGLYHLDYEGETFRDSLGLPFAVNRYTAKRGAREAA
jgi:alkanesulfonate monooxygenase SsuD/methylene tetrahydromethanopterin reductase-like flavin-dependent oxidoreductase (luciferase family)